MPVRLSGLVTGLDTEAIVGQMMSAQSLKKTRVVQAKTKLEWKKTAWQDMNKKLTTFYNTQASKLRLPSTYKVKKTNVSDTSKATVNADSGAVTGNYTMQVKAIATSQYLTGAKTELLTSTGDLLSKADPSLVGKTVSITTGVGENAKTTNIEITADTKVSDFVSQLQKAGLNANYDTGQKRFFISSKGTGVDQAFSMTTASVSSDEINARNDLRTAIGYDSMTAADKKSADELISKLQTTGTSGDAYDETVGKLAKLSYDSKNNAATDAATNLVKAQLYADHYADALTEAQNSKEIRSQFYELNEDGSFKIENGARVPKAGTSANLPDDYDAAVKKKAEELSAKYADEHIGDEENATKVQAYRLSGVTESDITALGSSDGAVSAKTKYGVTTAAGMNGVVEEDLRSSIAPKASAYAGVENRSNALGEGDKGLSGLGIADMTYRMDPDTQELVYTYDKSVGMALTGAKDSKIVLNGAELTSSTSTVSANGLNINLVSETKGDEVINFSVSNDIDAVYNTIKTALKEYNDLMTDIKTKLGAESSKGYEPLTSEQKKAMSDDEVEEWEKKIKDSLFRNDSTLRSIQSSMRDALMSSVKVGDKTYALSSFGIMTSTDYQEGGLLHIYGDPDDAVYGDKQDMLKKALSENPDDTVEALTGIFEKLRSTMFSKMGQTEYSSALTFYNDKQIDKDISNYKTEIKTWEDKLADLEDSYYKKFTAMESAMAKLQAQQSSLGGLLGTG